MRKIPLHTDIHAGEVNKSVLKLYICMLPLKINYVITDYSIDNFSVIFNTITRE